MRLLIRNMASRRCIFAVKSALEQLGIEYRGVYIGGAELADELNATQYKLLAASLQEYGLELTEHKSGVILEKMEAVIMHMIDMEEMPEVSYSVYISEQLGMDYSYLSKMFLQKEGVTIQQYIIDCKIERVKQLLGNGKLTLTEIAYKLNYSSVAHLSNQFKKNTGVRPKEYMEGREGNVQPTDGGDNAHEDEHTDV